MIIDLYTIHQVEFTRTSITRAVKKILRSNSGKKPDGNDGQSKLSRVLVEIVKGLQVTHPDIFKNALSDSDKYKIVYDKYKGYDENPPKCRICGINPTPWNAENNKYKPICSDPRCIATAEEQYAGNMIRVHGTANLAATREGQMKMQAGRSIAKEYIWADGTTMTVLGSIELKTLAALEEYGITSDDVTAPAHFIIKYKIPGENENRTHYPDIFIKSLNLIISCKDGLENPNKSPHFKKDRLKNLCEYMSILNTTTYNYVQIEGHEGVKDISDILDTVSKMSKNSRYVVPPRIDFMLYGENEHLLDTIYFHAIVDDNSEIILPYISIKKYSSSGFIIIDNKPVYIDISNIYNDSKMKILTVEIHIADKMNFLNMITPSNIMTFSIGNIYQLLNLILNDDKDVGIHINEGVPVKVLNVLDHMSSSSAAYNAFQWSWDMRDLKDRNKKSIKTLDDIFGNPEPNIPIYGILAMSKDNTDMDSGIAYAAYVVGGKYVIIYDNIAKSIMVKVYNNETKVFLRKLYKDYNIKCYSRRMKAKTFIEIFLILDIFYKGGETEIIIPETAVLASHEFITWIHSLGLIISTVSVSLIVNRKFNILLRDIYHLETINEKMRFTENILEEISNIEDEEIDSLDRIEVKYTNAQINYLNDSIRNINERIESYKYNTYELKSLKNINIETIKVLTSRSDNAPLLDILKM